MLSSFKPAPVDGLGEAPALPGYSCPTKWPSSSASPSSSPLGSGSYFDRQEYPAMNHTIVTTSVTSPIAVTGPALAHAPYGPQPQLPVPPSGPAGAAAYSLPPQLYWSHPHPGATGSNSCGFPSAPVMFGEKNKLNNLNDVVVVVTR